MKVELAKIQDKIISSEDIYWKKKTGEKVLITKRLNFINHNLIQKLISSGCEVVCSFDSNNLPIAKFKLLYEQYSEEYFLEEKIKLRNQMLRIIVDEFVFGDRGADEVDALAIELFADQEKILSAEHDEVLFRRSLRIASAYIFSAFLLGYYESSFLKKTFNNVFENLLELGKTANQYSVKETLNYLRMQDSFEKNDFKVINSIASDEVIKRTVLFEKYDGSGPRKINVKEMTDLEIVLIALNGQYGMELDNQSIFKSIVTEQFACEKRVLGVLKRTLGIENFKELRA